jgi:hypothetical protein
MSDPNLHLFSFVIRCKLSVYVRLRWYHPLSTGSMEMVLRIEAAEENWASSIPRGHASMLWIMVSNCLLM